MDRVAPFDVLIVFQNPEPGRLVPYDDWYTNVHIRDAMRLPSGIAVQRFMTAEDQPVLDGETIDAGYFAHTIYEWTSAIESAAEHDSKAGTPGMEISRFGCFDGLRDYYYSPIFLSHDWNAADGFRRGTDILTALIVPPQGGEAEFLAWFRDVHAPATLALAGFASAALFELHEAQSLPGKFRFGLAAVYGLDDRRAALAAWGARHDARDPLDLSTHAQEVEQTCWQPRIARLLAEWVHNPSPKDVAEEERARYASRGTFFTRTQIENRLTHGDPHYAAAAE